MIPEKMEPYTTEGEKQFYKFLETVAKSDSRPISWYLPDIKGKEPDFLFFSDEVGLIIFEVKDWSLNQIRETSNCGSIFSSRKPLAAIHFEPGSADRSLDSDVHCQRIEIIGEVAVESGI